MLAKALRRLPAAVAFTLATLIALFPLRSGAQTGDTAASPLVPARITQHIDENSLVTLKGTVHPLANARNDRGAASDSMPLDRMHLVLKRSPAQESALKQLVNDLHTPGTASYHKWLTPDTFGKQFGPSDQDIATVEAWLQSHGFSVTKVNPGKQTIEIAGNVAQLRSAFHTQIRKYSVNGETHYANSTDPQIPAALAPVVGGFVTLNNFRVKNHARLMGKAQYDPKTDKATPEWTTGGNNQLSFVLSPADYAVQYDLNPLYTAGTNGSNQTIAIVNESNINIYLVNQFRSLFGLPANPPQVIIDGNDPGIDGINNPDGPNGASIEAYLDVEWSGAVAPNANIDLVIAADTTLEGGVYLAAEHAVYGNVAPIISVSLGLCEVELGSTNQFLSGLWEQAAAQGTTVLVSTGDSGSAGCDDDNTQYYAVDGQQVSGWASTPYNVAVGGTDFFYSSWNQGSSAIATQLGTYWNTTTSNSTPSPSIKGVIPEQPWNDSQYGLNINDFYALSGNTKTTIAGGSGGASNAAICSGTYSNGTTCSGTLSGYPKPSWQQAAGVPADSVRDIPDVSLFAADGDANASYYPICYQDGDCQLPASSVQITAVGGTSASTPSFAGIMALVNQLYGPQGQADFVLYPMKAQFPAAFHDVTNGTNSVPCSFSPTTPNCIKVANPITVTDPNFGSAQEGQIGSGTTAEYNSGAGYNLATGLGTVDANVLVANWNKVTFAPTGVNLTSPTAGTTVTHGASVTFTGTVAQTSGSATPTGDVAIMTDSTQPVQQGQTFFTLTNGSFTGTSTTLPGGTYNVWAHYGGDPKNAAASSTTTQITVNPEASSLYFNVLTPGSSGYVIVPSGTNNIPYGTQLVLSAQGFPTTYYNTCITPANPPASCSTTTPTAPTGTVTFKDGSTTINTAVVNAEGDAEYNPTDPVAPRMMTNVGSHSVTASYSGDKSYNPSTGAAITYQVVQANPQIILTAAPSTILAGQATTFTLLVQSPGVGAAPTGTVSISGAPSGTPGSVTLSSSGVDPQMGTTTSFATVTIPASVTAKTYTITFTYNGDPNYTSASQGYNVQVASAPGLKASTTVITTSSSATSPNAAVTVTVTVTGQGSVPPTGTITLVTSGYEFNPLTLVPATGTDKSSVSILVNSQPGTILQGANVLTAAYSGDTNYSPSSSPAVNLANPLSDFSMVPESAIVPVTAGGNGTDTINVSSVNGFSGDLSFTCTPASPITCSVNSSATLASGGSTPLTLTVNAGSSAALGSYNLLITGKDSTGHYVHTLSIQADVTGTVAPANFALSSNPSTLTLNAAATTGNTSTITVTPANSFTGNVALTSTVSGPSGATSPPTVTFNPTPVDITGAAAGTSVMTVATTATTTAGSYTITVTGTSGSTSENTTVTVTVNAPANANFTLMSSAAAAVNPGSSTTSTITVNPTNGFTGMVALSCTVTGPSGASNIPGCSLSPTSTSTTSTLTVTTTAATSGALDRPLNKFFAVGGGIAVAGLLFFGIPARRRSWKTMLGVIVFAIIVGFGVVGCGGSSSSGGGGNSGTTPGMYTVTVTGTSGTLTPQTTPVSVTVN